MIGIVSAWLNANLAYLRWAVLFISWAGIAWSVHHIDTLSDKAAQADHVEGIAQSAQKIVTVTQTITKVIHDAKDKCADTPMPAAILQQLH